MCCSVPLHHTCSRCGNNSGSHRLPPTLRLLPPRLLPSATTLCPTRAMCWSPTPAEIPPEKEAIVFEEIATMDFPFEGIPTVPPRKDMDRMAFFCGGCRC